MSVRETQPPEPTLREEKPLSLLPARSGAHPSFTPGLRAVRGLHTVVRHLEAPTGERGVAGRESKSCLPASPTPDCLQRISVREASGNTESKYLKFCNCLYQSQSGSGVKPDSLFLAMPEAAMLTVQWSRPFARWWIFKNTCGIILCIFL